MGLKILLIGTVTTITCKAMRIAYVAGVRIPTEKAAGLAIVRQCAAFASLGHQVVLYVPRRRNAIDADIRTYYQIQCDFAIQTYFTIDLLHWGKLGFYVTKTTEMLVITFLLFYTSVKYDYIYSRDQFLMSGVSLTKISKKIILEIHTKHDDFVTRIVAQRVSRLIVISNGLRRYYKALLQRNDIVVEPSGVDLAQFENLPSKAELRQKYQLPAEAVIFSYVGKYATMGESKGVDEIVESFALMYSDLPRAHLLIVGLEDGEASVLHNLALRKGLPGSAITFMPLVQADFAKYLMASDVLLMNYPNTEHYAYFMSPTKVFAYMAAGKPILTTDLPSIREIGSLGGTLYVSSASIDEYSSKMKIIALDILQYTRDADKNIGMSHSFSWKSRAERLLTISI
jgi:glycosyltransferase involved in cell wall biosynthesis